MNSTVKDVVRLVDVAKAANVSRVVAAHVLMGTGGRNTRCGAATAERVREVAGKLDYRPNRVAQQLRGARSQIIGVLSHPSPNELLSERLNLLEREADANGYRIIIGRVADQQEKIVQYLDDFTSRGVEGIIFLSALPADDQMIRDRLKTLSIPVLSYSKTYEHASFFNIDRAAGISAAVDHLLSQGYKRISMQLTTRTIDNMKSRLNGYEKSLVSHGRKINKKLIYSAEAFDVLDLESPEWPKRAKKVVEHLVLENGADAIIASDDIWAAFIIKHLQSIGKSVPKDVGVVGFDNSTISKIISPKITSIDQSNQTLAKRLVDFILKSKSTYINDDAGILIKPELVVRESSTRKKNKPKRRRTNNKQI